VAHNEHECRAQSIKGRAFIVRPGETGFVARDLQESLSIIEGHAVRLDQMVDDGCAAQAHARNASMGRGFESVYVRI
jgi:hypothetical protein